MGAGTGAACVCVVCVCVSVLLCPCVGVCMRKHQLTLNLWRPPQLRATRCRATNAYPSARGAVTPSTAVAAIGCEEDARTHSVLQVSAFGQVPSY